MIQRNHLSLDDAQKIVGMIQTELEKQNAGAAIAVVDEHGELITFVRTEGCPLPSINNAIHKAFTAAREGVESRVIGDKARQENFSLTNYGDLRYTGWGGGVPLKFEGAVVGAVGISGLPEEEDMKLARTTVQALGYQ